jgi:hypothetical protein
VLGGAGGRLDSYGEGDTLATDPEKSIRRCILLHFVAAAVEVGRRNAIVSIVELLAAWQLLGPSIEL